MTRYNEHVKEFLRACGWLAFNDYIKELTIDPIILVSSLGSSVNFYNQCIKTQSPEIKLIL